MSRGVLLVAVACAGCRGFFNPVHDPVDGGAGSDTAGPGPAIEYVQSGYGPGEGTSQKVIISFAVPQTAGDTIVVVAYWDVGTIALVNDFAGNVYKSAIGPLVGPGGNQQAIFFATNILAADAGSNSVRVMFSGSPAKYGGGAVEYANIDAANPIDLAVGKSGGPTEVPSSGTLLATSIGDMLVAGASTAGALNTTIPGYSMRLSAFDFLLADQQAGSSGDFAAITEAATTSNWQLELVAFRRR